MRVCYKKTKQFNLKGKFMERDNININQHEVLNIPPCSSEVPLRITLIIISIFAWIGLCFTIIGLIYAAIFGFIFLMMHFLFITHIRASAVRLSPEQFPDLFFRVEKLAQKAGIENLPEIYIMQQGGALNAFATKFLRSKIVVLYTDLLEACGEDLAAQDMIIGHELGHIHRGHLRWHSLTMPGRMIPFLGQAYSRACESTCDRYGAALCGDSRSALLGLTILAAGGKFAPKVNLSAFVEQRKIFGSIIMTTCKWLSTYPSLSERLLAIDPSLSTSPQVSKIVKQGETKTGIFLSLLILLIFMATIAGSVVFINKIKLSEKKSRVLEDLENLSYVIGLYYQEKKEWPSPNDDTFPDVWKKYMDDTPQPIDPFTGKPYIYHIIDDKTCEILSVGTDGIENTEDDIIYPIYSDYLNTGESETLD